MDTIGHLPLDKVTEWELFFRGRKNKISLATPCNRIDFSGQYHGNRVTTVRHTTMTSIDFSAWLTLDRVEAISNSLKKKKELGITVLPERGLKFLGDDLPSVPMDPDLIDRIGRKVMAAHRRKQHKHEE